MHTIVIYIKYIFCIYLVEYITFSTTLNMKMEALTSCLTALFSVACVVCSRQNCIEILIKRSGNRRRL